MFYRIVSSDRVDLCAAFDAANLCNLNEGKLLRKCIRRFHKRLAQNSLISRGKLSWKWNQFQPAPLELWHNFYSSNFSVKTFFLPFLLCKTRVAEIIVHGIKSKTRWDLSLTHHMSRHVFVVTRSVFEGLFLLGKPIINFAFFRRFFICRNRIITGKNRISIDGERNGMLREPGCVGVSKRVSEIRESII